MTSGRPRKGAGREQPLPPPPPLLGPVRPCPVPPQPRPHPRTTRPAAMTLAVFFGCTFIAFGPAFSLFLFTIARDPLRIIILIAGSVWGWGPWATSGHR